MQSVREEYHLMLLWIPQKSPCGCRLNSIIVVTLVGESVKRKSVSTSLALERKEGEETYIPTIVPHLVVTVKLEGMMKSKSKHLKCSEKKGWYQIGMQYMAVGCSLK